MASVDGDQGPRLRVAIVGSGPAGFYLADFLLKHAGPRIAVDMYERLPVPFGLVRFGVAPDHQSIKRAAVAFQRTAAQPDFRFFGNVEVGGALSVQDLLEHYHAVGLAYGAATDRRLGVPGEDLRGSFAATAFVGWYNGHPDFAERKFDLDAERAVVVGMGNVAMDVARIMVRSPASLESTDIADYALRSLRESQIREVVLLGRRGPAQAAFDLGELIDIAELPGVGVSVDGPLPPTATDKLDNPTKKTLEYLAKLPQEPVAGAERRVRLRFLASPVEVIGDGDRVRGLRIENNELYERDGSMAARGTGAFEDLPCGIVVRSIGYQGMALPGIPFDNKKCVVPNVGGRVIDSNASHVPGLYAVGWIKRGPTGLIGTNKSDAKETFDTMLKDLAEWSERQVSDPALLAAAFEQRGVRALGFPEWQRIDAHEQSRGKLVGKVREKLC
ncbi:MAG TPA: NADP oxidoreductase, partial [Polyangiaceae bacterium]|nr:NADP oxidoreductase [Polyangiaceae bacterium]